jgi:hypothetical protein
LLLSRNLLRKMASALALSVPLACGGKATGSAPAAAVTADDFPSSFAKTVCENVSFCCKQSAFGFDEATCMANAQRAIEQELPPPGQSFVGFDANAAGSCLSALATFLAQCTLPAGQTVPEVCERVLVGRVPLGGGCGSAAQCAPGSREDTLCISQTPGSEAVCSAPQMLGEPCAETCTSSAIDLLTCPNCAWGSRSQMCRTYPGMGTGGICFTNQGLYCAASGTCASLRAIGDPCPDGRCSPGGVCMQGICSSALGLSCLDFDCQSSDGYCDHSQVCTARVADGSPCVKDDQCQSLQCTQGRCTRLLANEFLCAGQVAL